MKIKTGDTVKILSGKDRGKKAKVISVFPDISSLVVDGVNMKKRHKKARRQDRKGEVILVPARISASAVQLMCSSCGKPTRIGFSTESGKKVRVCKRCGKPLS